jgi:LPXTG-motif cell wall-anchored protein
MKNMLLVLMVLPFTVRAHPGIGIVKDSRGVIYYTDLQQVWKIGRGIRSVAVPHVHTHELWVDRNDALHGEGGYYDAGSEKFYHYLWVRHANGRIDTTMSMRRAYQQQDFSLARDQDGNEYYVKRSLALPDTVHIFRRSPGGEEKVFATGSFGAVNWVHPQKDGSLLFVSRNALYRVDASGGIRLIRSGLANKVPRFGFSGNNIMTWGAWLDAAGNFYVAVFSDQAVKKIDRRGIMTEVYRSSGKWTPLHGLFDNEGRLWVLETSDKNEVRVRAADESGLRVQGAGDASFPFGMIIGFFLLAGALFYLALRRKNRSPLLNRPAGDL